MPQKKIIPIMTAKDFETKVQNYAKFSHMVIITDHARQQGQKRGITNRLIINTLRKGQIDGQPKWDAKKQNWTGKINQISAGNDITVVCAIRDSALIVTVVTAYGRVKR